MKCLGLDTNRLSYSTWSILVFFFHSTRDASCLECGNLVLVTVTTMSSEILRFYMVPMLQNMDQQTSVGSNFLSILYGAGPKSFKTPGENDLGAANLHINISLINSLWFTRLVRDRVQ